MQDRGQKSEVRSQKSAEPFAIDSSGETEVRFWLVGGRGYLKVTGRSEIVYDDNPAPRFKDDDK